MKQVLLALLLLPLAACRAFPAATPTPTSMPTFTPTPTSTATPAPTLTPTPGPSGPCDNPLLPLKVGNQWEYRLSDSGGSSTFTITSTGRQDTTYIVTGVEFTNHTNDFKVEKQAICQEGAIQKYPMLLLNMLFSSLLKDYFSGFQESELYAPSYQALEAAGWKMGWEISYQTENRATLQNPVGGPGLLVSYQTEIKVQSHVNGEREDVTTPAGAFPQAWKMTQDYSIPVTVLDSRGNGQGGVLTIPTTQWYAPYTGLVRARVDTVSLSVGGMEYTLPMQNTLELVAFTPGP